MKFPRRKFLCLTAGAGALSALPRPASALDYPARPVRIVVGFPASSGPDIVARLVGQRLSERCDQHTAGGCIAGHSGSLSISFLSRHCSRPT